MTIGPYMYRKTLINQMAKEKIFIWSFSFWVNVGMYLQ